MKKTLYQNNVCSLMIKLEIRRRFADNLTVASWSGVNFQVKIQSSTPPGARFLVHRIAVKATPAERVRRRFPGPYNEDCDPDSRVSCDSSGYGSFAHSRHKLLPPGARQGGGGCKRGCENPLSSQFQLTPRRRARCGSGACHVWMKDERRSAAQYILVWRAVEQHRSQRRGAAIVRPPSPVVNFIFRSIFSQPSLGFATGENTSTRERPVDFCGRVRRQEHSNHFGQVRTARGLDSTLTYQGDFFVFLKFAVRLSI